jgi:hypothetical protein
VLILKSIKGSSINLERAGYPDPVWAIVLVEKSGFLRRFFPDKFVAAIEI